MTRCFPEASGYGSVTRTKRSERLDRRFGAIGMKFIETGNQAIAPSRCISSFHFEDTVAILFPVNQPAFRSFQDGDLVAIQAATSAEKGFSTVNRIFLESVNHDMGFSSRLKQNGSFSSITLFFCQTTGHFTIFAFFMTGRCHRISKGKMYGFFQEIQTGVMERRANGSL